MLSLFIVLVLLGFPIAFTLLAMGVAFGYYAYYQEGSVETLSDVFSNQIFYLLNQNTYSVMENDTLVAIPLFLFMGYDHLRCVLYRQWHRRRRCDLDGPTRVSGDG